MSLNVSEIKSGSGSGSKQKALDAGTYPARVVQIIDLGVQEQRPYQGQDKPPAHEVSITYELVDEFCKDESGNDQLDKPRWVSETFTLNSLKQDKAKSTTRYKAIDPELAHGGDFSKLIDAPCLVTVVQRVVGDKTYVNVASVSSVRKKDADNMAKLVNKPLVFLLDTPDLDALKSLPDWLQEKIKGNLKFKGSALEKALSGGKVVSSSVTVEESTDGEW